MLADPPGPPLILASGSAARARLLTAAGLCFEVRSAAVDEEAVRDGLMAEAVGADDAATALAELKAGNVALRAPVGAIVLGADQILEADGRWLAKPPGRDAARAQLRELRGRRHRLVSAVVAYRDGGRVWHHVDTALITLRPFSDACLEAYLDAAGDRRFGLGRRLPSGGPGRPAHGPRRRRPFHRPGPARAAAPGLPARPGRAHAMSAGPP